MTHHVFLDDRLAAALRADTIEAASARWLQPAGEMPLPDRWTPEFVGVRLIEAYRIEARLPRERCGPRGHGCGMPAYVHEVAERKPVWNERKRRYELAWVAPDPDHAGYVDASLDPPRETIARPTADEMARMERILAWPGRFLAHDAEVTACTASWAAWEAQERDTDEMAERFYWAKARAFQAKRREGLRLIARGLNAAGEGVF